MAQLLDTQIFGKLEIGISTSSINMTATSAGRLGIGTTNPVATYDVVGTEVVGIITGNVTGTTNLNAGTGNYFKYTTTANGTISFTNIPSNRAYFATLELVNGGAYTVGWGTAIKWPGGISPTLISSGTDVLTFVSTDGGTTVRGVLSIADAR